MENFTNPAVLDLFLTAFIGGSVLATAGLTLWLLPWTDKSIRSIDKTLNPIDLTQDGIRLPTLSRA